MSRSFLNFVPVSGTRTRFESRSRHKHRSLVAIGPGQICVSKKNGRQFSYKDFPRGQVNGFAHNLDLKKLNVRQTKK